MSYLKKEVHFVFTEIRAVYEVMWKNMVELDRQQMTILYGAEKIRFACRQISPVRIQTDRHTDIETYRQTYIRTDVHTD